MQQITTEDQVFQLRQEMSALQGEVRTLQQTLDTMNETLNAVAHTLLEHKNAVEIFMNSEPFNASIREELRKEKNRLRMAKKRHSASNSVRAQDVVRAQKEREEKNEAGKENIPPTPPIREKTEEKKEGRENLEISPDIACARAREWPEWFAEFWESYPNDNGRRRDRAKCFEKFSSLMNDAAMSDGDGDIKLFNRMMDSIDEWRSTDEWMDGFVPKPLVWLENSRWEVEIKIYA